MDLLPPDVAQTLGGASERPLCEFLVKSVPAFESAAVLHALLSDLANAGWTFAFAYEDAAGSWGRLAPPATDSKGVLRAQLASRREEEIVRRAAVIRRVRPDVTSLLASGVDIDGTRIAPIFEVCASRKQSDVFRYCRLTSSVPYTDYVGRRVRVIVRDGGIASKPVIGVVAVGSPVFSLKPRDRWIGWNRRGERVRSAERLENVMDVYAMIAMPPYNLLLGGKLLCYLVASNEFRTLVEERYLESSGGRESRIALFTTTGFFGKSSVYNRVRYLGQELFQYVGESKGFGTIHLSRRTVAIMKHYSETFSAKSYNNGLSRGGNHIMHHLENCCRRLRVNPRTVLCHGNPRSVYVIPTAGNAQSYLRGETDALDLFDRPLGTMVEYWWQRWGSMRLSNARIAETVRGFRPEECVVHGRKISS